MRRMSHSVFRTRRRIRRRRQEEGSVFSSHVRPQVHEWSSAAGSPEGPEGGSVGSAGSRAPSEEGSQTREREGGRGGGKGRGCRIFCPSTLLHFLSSRLQLPLLPVTLFL